MKLNFNLFNPPGFVRVLHASPDAPAVDIYLNNEKVVSNLSFTNITDYLRLKPGRYKIEIYPATTPSSRPVLDKTVVIPPGAIYTIAAVNRLSNLNIFIISDPTIAPQEENSYLRTIHLSPNAPAVNVRLNNRTIFRNLRYQGISRYALIDPATYNINIFTTEQEQRVLQLRNRVLQSGFYYTVYVLGLVNEQPALQAIIPLDSRYQFQGRR